MRGYCKHPDNKGIGAYYRKFCDFLLCPLGRKKWNLHHDYARCEFKTDEVQMAGAVVEEEQ